MPLVEKTPYTVHVAATPLPFDDEGWVLEPHLICDAFSPCMAPSISEATLIWRFGEIARNYSAPHADADGMAYRDLADLEGKYVYIRCITLDRHWIGFVHRPAQINWAEETFDDGGSPGQRLAGGTQIFTAVGLEWFLARQVVIGESAAHDERHKRPHTYNAGCGDGRDLDLARRENMTELGTGSGLAAPFNLSDRHEFDFSRDAQKWNAWNAVVHLLSYHTPVDQVDVIAPCEFFFHDAAKPFLDWYTPTIPEIEGRSVWQVLQDLIDERRALAWQLKPEVHDLGSGNVIVGVIHVTSLATAAVAMPDGGTLPAATSIVQIDDPNALETLQPIGINRKEHRLFHRVRVRGARRTTTASAKGPYVEGGVSGYTFQEGVDSTIAGAWTAEEQTDYGAGVRPQLSPEQQAAYDAMADKDKKNWNDRYRQNEKFERVYRYFVVELGGTLSPVIIQSTGSVVGWITTDKRVIRLLPKTVLRAGYDYADATAPTVNGDLEPDIDGEEYLPPFALGYLPKGAGFIPTTLGKKTEGSGEVPSTSSDAGWRRMHNLDSHKEKGFEPSSGAGVADLKLKSADLQIRAGHPGFIMRPRGGLPHALAASGDEEGFAVSKTPVTSSLSWGALLVTWSVEWDAYCEAVWPEALPTASPIEELLIKISERARFDYLCKGTVYDLTAQGDLKQCTTGGAIRDDRKLCETIARLAYQWYGSERAQVTLELRQCSEPVNVGDLLTTIGTGDAEQTVNALVTHITHRLEEGGTTIRCGFPELNFAEIG